MTEFQTSGSVTIRIDNLDSVGDDVAAEVERGYSDGFDTFVFNYCSTDCHVTVDGEPVDPRS